MGSASDGPRLLLHRHDGASTAHVAGESTVFFIVHSFVSPQSFPSLPLLLFDSIFTYGLIQKDVSFLRDFFKTISKLFQKLFVDVGQFIRHHRFRHVCGRGVWRLLGVGPRVVGHV